MTSTWLVYTCLAIGLSGALVAGVFQSFSDFVMRALVAAAPAAGVDVMQMINRTVFRSVFLIMMLGLAPVLLGLGAYAYFTLSGPAQIWIISGAVIYVISVFLVTMIGNVPMNNRLDPMAAGETETDRYWKTYGKVWTRLNHVRTVGSAATAICFLAATTMPA